MKYNFIELPLIEKITKLFTVVFFLIMISCNSRPIKINCGISEVSERGIRHFQPLIEALQKYKSENGKYPRFFNDLIPKYIDRIPIINQSFPESSQFNTLNDENLGNSIANISDDNKYFSIRFYPKDERICLTGRNNICEYTSETKEWKCYMH